MNRAFGASVAVVLLGVSAGVIWAGEDHPNIVQVRSGGAGTVYICHEEVFPVGDKAPPNVFMIEIGGRKRFFRPLRVGDHVQEGELLAVVDDGKARKKRQEAEARLRTMETRLAESIRFKKDAEEYLRDTEASLTNRPYPAGSRESDRLIDDIIKLVRIQKAALKATAEEEASRRKECVELERRYRQARAEESQRCEVRAIRGRVTKILAQSGQSVRAGDVLLLIETDTPK